MNVPKEGIAIIGEVVKGVCKRITWQWQDHVLNSYILILPRNNHVFRCVAKVFYKDEDDKLVNVLLKPPKAVDKNMTLTTA